MISAFLVFLKTTRWLNLFITALTLNLSYFLLLVPLCSIYNLPIMLGVVNFQLLVFSVLLIMAAGYLVNDVEDEDTDVINQKGKALLKEHSLNQVYAVYFTITALGLALGFLVCMHLDALRLWSIHLLAALFLFLYAIKLKGTPLAGNLIIALLCGIIPILPLIFNMNSYSAQLRPEFLIFNFMAIFAATTTVIRELIKDMEDVEGDLATSMFTLPVIAGIKTAKWVTGVFMTLYFILIVAFLFLFYGINWISFIYLILFTLLPMCFISFKLIRANSRTDFHKLSLEIKALMFGGVIFIVVYYFETIY